MGYIILSFYKDNLPLPLLRGLEKPYLLCWLSASSLIQS
jgi:hypothetical protein